MLRSRQLLTAVHDRPAMVVNYSLAPQSADSHKDDNQTEQQDQKSL